MITELEKKIIKELYLKDKRQSNKEVNKNFECKTGKKISDKTIGRILKKLKDDYKKELEEIIVGLYFRKDVDTPEISKQLNIPRRTISNILNKYEKYKLELDQRKARNRLKHKEYTKEYMREKQKEEKKRRLKERKEDEAIFYNLRRQQEINAIGMSNRSKVSKQQLVEINLQHYTLEKQNNKLYLVFNENVGKAPQDLFTKIRI